MIVLLFLLVSGLVAVGGFAYAFYVTIFFLWDYRPKKPILSLKVPYSLCAEDISEFRKQWSSSAMRHDYHLLVVKDQECDAKILKA